MDMTQNQTNLYPLGKDKDIVIKTFMKNEDMVSLILPNYDEATATEDLDVILKEHLFKTISIDNAQIEKKVYVCVETYVPEIENDAIKKIAIIINVFAHQSLIDLSVKEQAKFLTKGYYGNRVDMLIDVIDRCLNGKRNVGLGRLRLRPRNPIGILQPVNGYYGKSLEYIISDFNSIDEY